MKRLCLLIFASACLSIAHAQDDSALQPQSASSDRQPAKEIKINGQVFTLANNSASGLVSTFEYTLAGEQYSEWTQLLTHQVIALANPVTAEEFVAYFQRKVRESDPGTAFEVVRQSPRAAVFQVVFPRTQVQDEQIMLCLCFPDPHRAEMNVVQYALRPNKLSANLVQLQVKSWLNILSQRATAVAEAKGRG